jgi:hypothetical protein
MKNLRGKAGWSVPAGACVFLVASVHLFFDKNSDTRILTQSLRESEKQFQNQL